MLRQRSTLAVLAFLILAACARADTAPSAKTRDFFFKDGDTVVMMGDSITEQRLYSQYVEMWTLTRFPNWKLVFRNVGIGGDRSTGGNKRFQRDVVAHKATALTVDFGMNDGNYQTFQEGAFATYVKGLQGIADQAKAAKVRVAWITPQPVEHNPGAKQEFYNDTLEKFSAGVMDIAAKNGGLFVDQFHPYWAVVAKARDAGETGRITGGDAVHPGPPGQALMAAAILKGLHFPRLVSLVETDATSKTETKTVNCKITDRVVADNNTTLRFKRQDNALPYFPEAAKSILKWSDLLNELNYYGLKVKGLKPGRYEVKLGGKKVAEYTDKELAAGVNLAGPALSAGPVADQVNKVAKAVNDKTTYFHGQIFRGVQLAGPKSPAFKDVAPGDIEAKRQALYTERMAKMPELDAAIQQALVMAPHQVEIVRIGD
jgi:lysophospholipase L1-like esterase